jgi:putative peptidoglycan lipid II flippase
MRFEGIRYPGVLRKAPVERLNMTSTYRKVGIASLVMMASVFLSKIIGLVRDSVIGGVKGAGVEVDNYLVAFTLPEILNHLIVSGFLSITFIPIFSKYLVQNREEEGWRIFSIILTCFGTILLALIVLGETCTLPLLHLIAPGKTLPEEIAPILKMTRIILPAQFFFFAGGLFMAVQFAKEQFFIPAIAGLIYNIGIVTGGLILGPSMGMEGFSWGVLGGALVGNFILQMIGAKRVGMRFSPSFAVRHPDLRKYFLLTLPLMIGLTPNFSIEFLFRFFGSFLPEGGIASINFALRIMFVVVGLFGQAVATAFFPFMTRLVTENNIKEANRLLNRTLGYLSLTLSVAMLLMVLRTEIVAVVFQRGAFDAAATAITSRVLLFLMPTAVAMAAFALVVRGYYAKQNTLFPAIFSTIAVLLTLPLYYFGMRSAGPQGIAVAMSLSTTFQALLLYIVWNRRTKNDGSRQVYISFLKMAVLSAVIGVLLEWIRQLLAGALQPVGFFHNLLIIIGIAAFWLGLLVAFGTLLRFEEITQPLKDVWGEIRHRILRKN